jgi:hypothetical protein
MTARASGHTERLAAVARIEPHAELTWPITPAADKAMTTRGSRDPVGRSEPEGTAARRPAAATLVPTHSEAYRQ